MSCPMENGGKRGARYCLEVLHRARGVCGINGWWSQLGSGVRAEEKPCVKKHSCLGCKLQVVLNAACPTRKCGDAAIDDIK